ncbi:hypothetical protein F4808DRAFT_458752 [Astrocystis sublimbata]|nr:hypothetical protein F4808DRAFT_458752 [Astrocystis sublimbata]
MATINAAGRTVWNDKARSDLLQAIVDVCPPSQQQWETIIKKLQAKGYTYNHTAALQHLQKLKKKEGPADKDGAEGPATPKKATKATTATPGSRKPRATPGTGRRGKRSLAVDEDEADDKQPMKKLKFEPEVPRTVQNGAQEEFPAEEGEI